MSSWQPPLSVWSGHLARFVGQTWARWHYARRIEPTWLEVNRHRLVLPRWPASLDGLRVVHLTDLHCGKHLPLHYLEEALARAQAEQPDLIALTGDYVHKGYRYVSTVARLLGQLRAPLGVFAVLGNHDFSVRTSLGWRRHPRLHQVVTEALLGAGIQVLRNRTVTLHYRQTAFQVAGIDDLWSGMADPQATFAHCCPHTPRLILAHNPRTAELIHPHRGDLILAGHTHGGQVNWPGWGPITLPRQARRYAAGLFHLPNGHLYVNKGIGFGWRLRFNTRPEIATFSLHAPPASPCGSPVLH
ncbi:MAG: metallophosphoesterase [Gemmataceae bacterium]|nr:metallophosphoesterase [Gemmataceae bacterium]MCS7271657.1 metallophosphoesterase [Gemmataceae bacterium]MDW8244508.1 metallophosphoesterase [Thermogemmata sp.]